MASRSSRGKASSHGSSSRSRSVGASTSREPVRAPLRAPLTSVQHQVYQCIVDYRAKHGMSPTLQEIGDKLDTHRVTVYAHVKALLEKKYLIRYSNNTSRSLVPADEVPAAGMAPDGESPTGGAPGASMRSGALMHLEEVDVWNGPSQSEGTSAPTPPTALLLPLAGRIAAGKPIEAVYDHETIDLAALFPQERDLYVLEVRGDSMIDDQIRDGDYVVVEKRSSARNGEIVVAVLPHGAVDEEFESEGFGSPGEATLKRFYREGTRVRLQPSNAQLKPMYFEKAGSIEIRGVVVGVIRRYRS